jgi:subtilisin family serine protease
MPNRVRTIAQPALAGRTGRGLWIAVIDSGVHPQHPHIGNVHASVAFDDAGALHDDVVDRLGHGTAVAAAIHEKAPDAALLVIKVFDRQLAATGTALAAAIDYAIDAGAQLINLSLGTTNDAHRPAFERLVAKASARGGMIVAAAPSVEQQWLPGAVRGVIGVELDWTSARDECLMFTQDDGGIRVRASGYARPIPGVSLEQNLKGQSLAVANATGLLALVFDEISNRAPNRQS